MEPNWLSTLQLGSRVRDADVCDGFSQTSKLFCQRSLYGAGRLCCDAGSVEGCCHHLPQILRMYVYLIPGRIFSPSWDCNKWHVATPINPSWRWPALPAGSPIHDGATVADELFVVCRDVGQSRWRGRGYRYIVASLPYPFIINWSCPCPDVKLVVSLSECQM